MIDYSENDKNKFFKYGYIVKNFFYKDNDFLQISNELKHEISKNIQNIDIEILGGYKSGNLNLNPGKFGNYIYEILTKKNFKEFFKFITQDDLENYSIQLGGNLNLPKSKNQLFHTDGPWNPRMLILNIATTQIDISNGPIEIYEKSHIQNYPYWKFHFKKFLMKKKKIRLNFGEILFREHRLWHRGTKNNSDNYREMIGIMFLKKKQSEISNQEVSEKIKIFSNIFGTSTKEKIKEYIFLYCKPILFLYKFFISINK